MAEGWYQLRQTVHLFNSELFAFDIHLVSDNAAKIPRRRADVKIEKLWQRSVGHFRKADGGTFWRAPKAGFRIAHFGGNRNILDTIIMPEQVRIKGTPQSIPEFHVSRIVG